MSPLSRRATAAAAVAAVLAVSCASDQPVTREHEAGTGWRVVASEVNYSDGFQPPEGAATAEDLGALAESFGFDSSGIDLDDEIVIAHLVATSSECHRQELSELSVDETTGQVRLGLVATSTPSRGCERYYQLLVVAIERDWLPDVIILDNRLARTELRVR